MPSAVGTLLSGYSSFGSGVPVNMGHPAVAKITLAPGHNPGKAGAPKPPKIPDKPVQPYMRYSRKVWDSMKQSHPELKTYEIAREIGKAWRQLGENERRHYQREYEMEKSEYYDKVNAYNRSPAYQQYLAAKQRWESAEIKDDDDMYFSMEPVDDVQTDDNQFSYRSLCAARFHRNKFFMMDILSESVVINSMKIMRQEQLDSLSVHRKTLIESIDKFKKSIEEMKEQHVDRKRVWSEKSDNLTNEWKRLAKMTPQEYYAEFKAKQEQARQQRAKEEEEKKQKEAEKAKEEAEKAEKGDKETQQPQLETMEAKQKETTTMPTPNAPPPLAPAHIDNSGDKTDKENPIQAMHQMVSMAGTGDATAKDKQEDKPDAVPAAATTAEQTPEKMDEAKLE